MRKYAGARLGYRPGGEECWRGEAIISLRRCVGKTGRQIGQKPAPRIAEANPGRAKILEFGAEGGIDRQTIIDCSIDGGLASNPGHAAIDFKPGNHVEERKLIIISGLN